MSLIKNSPSRDDWGCFCVKICKQKWGFRCPNVKSALILLFSCGKICTQEKDILNLQCK